jgi:hypothetical protein
LQVAALGLEKYSQRPQKLLALKMLGKSIGSRGLTCKKQPPTVGGQRGHRYIGWGRKRKPQKLEEAPCLLPESSI